MPEGEQRNFKAHPKNIERGFVDGLLQIKQNYCAADLGSVIVVGEGPFLAIDSEDVLGLYLGEHNLELSLKLFSERDELLLKIDRNEWISGDPLAWDIEADWQTLTIRERARKISVAVNGKVKPLEIRGEFWRSGKRVQIGKDGIIIGDTKSGVQDLALVGTKLTIDTASMSIAPQAGNPFAVLVSWPNRRERLWKAKEAWQRIYVGKSR
jgi:hypothetical protein